MHVSGYVFTKIASGSQALTLHSSGRSILQRCRLSSSSSTSLRCTLAVRRIMMWLRMRLTNNASPFQLTHTMLRIISLENILSTAHVQGPNAPQCLAARCSPATSASSSTSSFKLTGRNLPKEGRSLLPMETVSRTGMVFLSESPFHVHPTVKVLKSSHELQQEKLKRMTRRTRERPIMLYGRQHCHRDCAFRRL